MTEAQRRNFDRLWKLYDASNLARDVAKWHAGHRTTDMTQRVRQDGPRCSLIQFLHFCGLVEAGIESRTLIVPASAAIELRQVLSLKPIQTLSSQFLMKLPLRLLGRLNGEISLRTRESHDDWYRRLIAFDLSLRDLAVEEFLTVAGVYGDQTRQRDEFVDYLRDPDELAAAVTTPVEERDSQQHAVLGLETFLLLATDLEKLVDESPTPSMRAKVIEIYSYIVHRRGPELASLVSDAFDTMSKYSPDLPVANIPERDSLDRLHRLTGAHYHANEASNVESAIREFLTVQSRSFGPILAASTRRRLNSWVAPVRLVDAKTVERDYVWLRRQIVNQKWPEGIRLEGAPGTGKTTLLHRLAVDISRRYLRGLRTNRVAIFFPVRHLSDGTRLLDALCEHIGLDRDVLLYAFSMYDLVLLIDGFDEINEDNRQRCVASLRELRAAGCRFTTVVSVRQGDFGQGLEEFEPVTLEGVPTTEAIKWALKREGYTSRLPEELKRVSSETIPPFFLTLIAAVNDRVDIRSINIRPGKMVERFVKLMLEVTGASTIASPFKERDLFRALTTVAYGLFEDNRVSTPEAELLERLADVTEIEAYQVDAAELLGLLVKMGFFVRDLDRNEISWSYRGLVEHLSARYCTDRFQSHDELARHLLLKVREDKLETLSRAIIDQWPYDEIIAFGERVRSFKVGGLAQRQKLLDILASGPSLRLREDEPR